MFRFLKCVARAMLINAPRALLEAVPFGGVIYEVARDAIADWKNEQPQAADRRADLQALAVATPAEVRRQAEQVVAAVAADQPEPLRLALVRYLTHLPGTVRRSLSRPADLTGTTVPADRALDRAEDLLPLLPSRPPHPQLHAGRRLGDWELVELVGAGGFGEVWKATNPHLPPAAFKFCTDAVAAKALRNEAVLLGRVARAGRHKGIVALEDTSLTHEPPYLRYEFVPGGDLTGLIQDWKRLKAPARVEPALRLMRQLADIVGFAHAQGIIHRDLKPANILLQPADDKVKPANDEPFVPRVADFGIGGVSASQALQQTRIGTTPGEFLTTALRGSCTPLYASPQQRRGEDPDPRDDVYSLGVIWYQLLLADPLAEVSADWRDDLEPCAAPEAVLNLLAQCLAAKPDKRPANGAALAEKIGELAAPASPRTPVTPTPGVRKSGDITTVNLAPGLDMKFAWIPPGTFVMGSPPAEKERSDDESQHRVTLTRGFCLGTTQVTQAQWRAVMGSNPSNFRGDHLPVEQVSWDDCQEFCHKLGEKTGKRFRLPTEAEWEYACRAGTTTPFYFGETISTDQANYDGNYTYGNGKKGVYRQKTTSVGTFPPNAWGLYDMHGNVWEWCSDWYGPYPAGEVKDPQGDGEGDARVLRGGSWCNDPWICRAACRAGLAPGHRVNHCGCRVVLCLD